jgi:Tfp pilus assembly protein PilF
MALVGLCACVTAHNPALSQQRFLLGADLYTKNRLRPATEELLKAVEADPNNADAHNLLGLIFLRQGVEDTDLAERVQCLGPDEAATVKAQVEDKFRKAESSFYEALRSRPAFSEAHNNLAVVSIELKKYDLAIEHAQLALRDILYKEPHIALGNLGWAYYLRNRDWVRASKELRQAVFHEPRFCVGHYRLGRVLFERGQYDDAAEELDKVAKDASCPIQEAHQLLGMAHVKRHQAVAAAAAFQACVGLAPRSCVAKECRRYVGLLGKGG